MVGTGEITAHVDEKGGFHAKHSRAYGSNDQLGEDHRLRGRWALPSRWFRNGHCRQPCVRGHVGLQQRGDRRDRLRRGGKKNHHGRRPGQGSAGSQGRARGQGHPSHPYNHLDKGRPGKTDILFYFFHQERRWKARGDRFGHQGHQRCHQGRRVVAGERAAVRGIHGQQPLHLLDEG
ncbi:MAG: hypothetical protein BWX71_02728 [Deltaproteobacteria bacterium ADurb.Bin072]|nr:MAG: hypothetical protein BWX71_02728 [Deltaproteobacteria bacterium ADurb.Bin072]